MRSDPAEQEIEDLLSAVRSMLDSGNVVTSLRKLRRGLADIRKSSSTDVWAQICEYCHSHPISQLIYQDPFTRWSHEKPRKHQGDAMLLDFIYHSNLAQIHVSQASKLGRKIYEAVSNKSDATQAVRSRLRFIARKIDESAARIDKPHILSVGCGHLREAHLALSVQERRIGRFVAVDQDFLALQVVASEFSRFGVETLDAPFLKLLKGRPNLGQFDFIYATGVYDYLSERLARRLTAYLFTMLRPGGKLLVANFMPDIPDIGYLEAFMDWHLIYRTRKEMELLAKDIPFAKLGSRKTTVIWRGNIVFLEITKTT